MKIQDVWGGILVAAAVVLLCLSAAGQQAAPSNDNPPNYLLINGERWKVTPFDFAGFPKGTTGDSDCAQREIRYKPGNWPASQRREDMWHEIAHANYCYQRGRMKANWARFVKDMPEHEVVYEIGMFLTGFVHDNPEFMQWAGNWKEAK